MRPKTNENRDSTILRQILLGGSCPDIAKAHAISPTRVREVFFEQMSILTGEDFPFGIRFARQNSEFYISLMNAEQKAQV